MYMILFKDILNSNLDEITYLNYGEVDFTG